MAPTTTRRLNNHARCEQAPLQLRESHLFSTNCTASATKRTKAAEKNQTNSLWRSPRVQRWLQAAGAYGKKDGSNRDEEDELSSGQKGVRVYQRRGSTARIEDTAPLCSQALCAARIDSHALQTCMTLRTWRYPSREYVRQCAQAHSP